LVAAHSSGRDERRVITALFADIAGSTQLGEQLDPEDFRELTGGALARMGSAIESFGGRVRGTAGDGILGLFGAPTAHEDDAERAVVAGLKLVETLREYGRDAAERWGVRDFHVRVGIETGLAVVGEVRAGSHVQYDASGDCLNTAARLEGAADVDGVLVGPLTHRLVSEAFDWGDERPLALKGKADLVLARHALASRGGRPTRGTAAVTRLVGRDREVARADEIVADVLTGTSRTIFVTGVAGIGKTRFMNEVRSLFDAAVRDSGVPPLWLEGRCLSYGGDEPYLPFRQILGQVLEHGVDALPDVLEMVLGLEPGDSSRIAGLSAESLQQLVIEAFVDLVVGLSARGAVCIALDDLHWADAASLRLTEGLIAALAVESPVLLVVGMRSETDRSAWSLRDRMLDRDLDRTAELRLSALDRDAERGLVSSLVGEGTLPRDLESRLLQRAEGNPFYLRELLRSLRDTGAIVEMDGQWSFDHDVPVELPDTVERVVLARIDRLSSGDRDLLNAAAVLGRDFDLPLMARVAGADLAPTSLGNLIHLGLVERAGTDFRFSHPLIQETAYQSMLRRSRAELHGRAAAAIEELAEAGLDGRYATLARHHSAAGHIHEAVTYHRLAAIGSLRVAASDEALKQLDLALGAASTLDEEEARRRLPELHLLRGRARGRLGDYNGGIADVRQALDSARVVADSRTEMQAHNDLGWLLRVHSYEEGVSHHEKALSIADGLDDPAAQVTALSRMSMIELNRLRLDVGLGLAERALVIARATGLDALLGEALDCLKLAAMQLGDLELLDSTVDEIMAVHERTGDLYLLQWAHIEGATASVARGDLDQARARIAKAVEINGRFASDRVSKAMILEARSWIDRADDNTDAAVTAVREAIATLGEFTTPEWSAWLEASLGSHLIAQGNVEEAIAVLESALQHSEATKSPNRALRAGSHLAWARSLFGNVDGSRAALVEAEQVLYAITAPPGEVFLDGYHSYLAIARTRLAMGDELAAQDLLTSVHAAAGRNGWVDAASATSELLSGVSVARD
jgi:class 3 adenylate cyclase/tetratricopeptide (TPR) repeat protein